MNLKFTRNKIFQIIYTSVSFITTFLLPIVGYFQIKITTKECSNCPNVEYGSFIEIVDQTFIWLFLFGAFITLTRYLIYCFPKFSFQRSGLSLLNSMLFVAFFIKSSSLATLNATYKNQQLFIDFSGVFVLLISFWSLFIVRDIFNTVDF